MWKLRRRSCLFLLAVVGCSHGAGDVAVPPPAHHTVAVIAVRLTVVAEGAYEKVGRCERGAAGWISWRERAS